MKIEMSEREGRTAVTVTVQPSKLPKTADQALTWAIRALRDKGRTPLAERAALAASLKWDDKTPEKIVLVCATREATDEERAPRFTWKSTPQTAKTEAIARGTKKNDVARAKVALEKAAARLLLAQTDFQQARLAYEKAEKAEADARKAEAVAKAEAEKKAAHAAAIAEAMREQQAAMASGDTDGVIRAAQKIAELVKAA